MSGVRGGGPHKGHCAGAVNHRAKLVDSDARSILSMHADGWPQKVIARVFKTSKSNVHCIVTRLSWRHVKQSANTYVYPWVGS